MGIKLLLFLLALIIFIIFICVIICVIYNNDNNATNYDNFNIIKTIDGSYMLPKKIFAYFDDLQNNNIIKAHYENWKKKFPEWEIIFLDNNTVTSYLNNEGIKYFKSLQPIQFSDYLRFYLLKQYGGVWIDAGIIVFNGSFLNKYYNEMMQNKYDVCVYEFVRNTNNKNVPYLENWFIMAPKNSKYISDILDEYTNALEKGFLNYKFNVLIPSGVDLSSTLKTGEHNKYNTYLMQHAIINYLMHKGNKYHINIKIADNGMFDYVKHFNWKHDAIVNHILKNNNWNNLHAYKLIGGTRKAIGNKEKDYIKKILSL